MTIGADIPRVEGAAKVTGAARYAADNTPPRTLHALIVGAPVASGRIISVDIAAAVAIAGVRVLTRSDMPQFGKLAAPAAVLTLPMQDDKIRHEGEAIAIVLAETIAAAEEARAAVVVYCERETPLIAGAGKPDQPPAAYPFGLATTRGDVAAGLAAAFTTIEQTYQQPARHHNAIETSGTVAWWEGDRLHLYDSVQAASNVAGPMAAALGIDAGKVSLLSPHTGGGFGCKSYVWPHQILTAAAARIVARPVKLHLRRADQYAGTGYQPFMRHDMTLAADRDGHLIAIRHIAINTTAIADTFFEPATVISTSLYACPAVETRPSLERVNANLPTPMRAPVEGPGLFALESAMNELADTLGLDPLDLRIVNHADHDPHSGKPWSSKKLLEAYAEGAKMFGWQDRCHRPKSAGHWRLGRGMASCSMGTFRFAGAARVRLRSDGTARIEVNVQDFGTGVQTILTQIAADALGIALARVSIVWGDSALPATGPGYGSSTTIHTGSAVAQACADGLEKCHLLPDEADFATALRRSGRDEMIGEGRYAPPGDSKFDVEGGGGEWSVRTFGAVFIEIGVDPDLGLVRLRRAVGAYSAGRILNARTAQSQMIGGIIWGWGKSVMEASVQEPTHGRWLSKNLSNVHVPVNADIPSDIHIHFVDEFDANASPIGAKGIGELGATGVDAAVAAAIYDAVGIRLRVLPFTPSRVIRALSTHDR